MKNKEILNNILSKEIDDLLNDQISDLIDEESFEQAECRMSYQNDDWGDYENNKGNYENNI